MKRVTLTFWLEIEKTEDINWAFRKTVGGAVVVCSASMILSSSSKGFDWINFFSRESQNFFAKVSEPMAASSWPLRAGKSFSSSWPEKDYAPLMILNLLLPRFGTVDQTSNYTQEGPCWLVLK